MRVLLSIILVTCSQHAWAQQSLTPLLSHISISGTDCQRLIKHVPDAQYRPGVDVHGKPVAPADLPGSAGALKVPNVIEFDYTLNPMTYGGANSLSSKGLDAGNTMMKVAKISYDIAANRFTINGQPLGGADESGIAKECRKRVGQ